ncbi:tripartite tricarboxylate transporter TctB family protein [Auraticoccus monumenti]|nr:tripartite tricarboxylate transporter TctB family protein [Auraticoccus monumenti]
MSTAGGPGSPVAGEQEGASALPAQEPERRPMGTTANLVVAGLVVALGVAAVAGALSQGVGSAGQPGPGTFPLVLGVLLVLLGVGLAVLARRSDDAERFDANSWRVLAGLGTLVGYLLAFPRIGFEIPMLLVAFVWLRFIGGESWRTSVLVSLLTTLAFYLVFVGALGVTIPHLF